MTNIEIILTIVIFVQLLIILIKQNKSIPEYVVGKIVDKSTFIKRKNELKYFFMIIYQGIDGYKKFIKVEVDQSCFNTFNEGDNFGVNID